MSVFQQVQLALILCGAKPGHPSYYKDDKTTVATGDEIAIEVRWKNKEGKTEQADARNWIRDVKTKKPPAKTGSLPAAVFPTTAKAENTSWPTAGNSFAC